MAKLTERTLKMKAFAAAKATEKATEKATTKATTKATEKATTKATTKATAKATAKATTEKPAKIMPFETEVEETVTTRANLLADLVITKSRRKYHKIDFTSVGYNFMYRVANFNYFYFLKKEEIKSFYNKKIKECEDAINSAYTLEGSVLENKIPEIIRVNEEQIEKWRNEMKEVIKEERPILSEGEETFKKNLNKNFLRVDDPEFILGELRKLFQSYGLDITNTYFEKDLMRKNFTKLSSKGFVNSEVRNAEIYNGLDALKKVLNFTYTSMIAAHAIRPCNIPEILLDKYDVNRIAARKEKKELEKQSRA